MSSDSRAATANETIKKVTQVLLCRLRVSLPNRTPRGDPAVSITPGQGDDGGVTDTDTTYVADITGLLSTGKAGECGCASTHARRPPIAALQ